VSGLTLSDEFGTSEKIGNCKLVLSKKLKMFESS
jgi:hypothetical protein